MSAYVWKVNQSNWVAHHPVDSTVALHRKMFSPLASLLLQFKHVGLDIVSTINEGVNVCVKACMFVSLCWWSGDLYGAQPHNSLFCYCLIGVLYKTHFTEQTCLSPHRLLSCAGLTETLLTNVFNFFFSFDSINIQRHWRPRRAVRGPPPIIHYPGGT